MNVFEWQETLVGVDSIATALEPVDPVCRRQAPIQ